MSILLNYLERQIVTTVKLLPQISPSADIEILHDFRVSLRHTISLLKLYQPKHPIIKALKKILKSTNNLRELDVMLASIDQQTYPELHDYILSVRNDYGAALITTQWRTETKRRLRCIQKQLRCPHVRKKIKAQCKKKRLILLTLQTYTANIKAYKKLLHHASDEAFHELRIAFKICRYGLTFLNEKGIYSAKKKIKRCKKIQDELGYIQDLSNQIAFLKTLCASSEIRGCKTLIAEHEAKLLEHKQKNRTPG